MSMFSKLVTWWDILVHHAHAGTLPDPPTGGNPIAVQPINPQIVTPPAPRVPPSVQPVPPVVAGNDGARPPTAPPPPADDGFYKLPNITNTDYQTIRHQVAEKTRTLSAGTFTRGSAQANLDLANNRYRVSLQFIGVGEVVEQYDDATTGAPAWRLVKPVQNIDGTVTWPDVIHLGFNLGTDAGVIAWVNQLAVRTTNAGTDFGPPHA